jgi:hypothetical protein
MPARPRRQRVRPPRLRLTGQTDIELRIGPRPGRSAAYIAHLRDLFFEHRSRYTERDWCVRAWEMGTATARQLSPLDGK